MKRRLYLLPLMAVTALSLSLAACDDNTAEENAGIPADQTSTMPATTPEAVVTTAPAVAPVQATNATAYATAEGARSGAIFVSLNNPNAAAHMLTGAVTDRAAMVELHQGYVDEADGTMQMRKVDSIEIPAGGTVNLEPGGYHIMLIDLASPLVEGDTFNVSLQFGDAGELSVPVTVTAPGAAASDATTTTYTSPEAHDHADEVPASDATATDEPAAEVPADAPVTDAPAADEQPAQ